MVYLANAFAVEIKQRDIIQCTGEYVIKSANTCVIFWYLEAVHSNHAGLMVEMNCSIDES